jgi:hypothetical protein
MIRSSSFRIRRKELATHRRSIPLRWTDADAETDAVGRALPLRHFRHHVGVRSPDQRLNEECRVMFGLRQDAILEYLQLVGNRTGQQLLQEKIGALVRWVGGPGFGERRHWFAQIGALSERQCNLVGIDP